MAEDDFMIGLSRDEALVFSDWLHRMMGTADFDELVDRDRAVWSPLYRISGALETSLVEVFRPGYPVRLQEARQRLLDALGEVGRPTGA
ncbi:hypothetical protein [Micromonospora sp. C28ISP2-4]|uniref:hypothetical protein n=1 Tax=Micromonospora sp. C28ISP2-4 TaxID=3059523 RepID=UPI0026748093|nr:hypothetical protein [Micromonospora sp. C28ISP2-4]MDO3685741.1 hypothetical protein [Micromonospora sp. C28ISP2-4]